jgi:hypothetical protein
MERQSKSPPRRPLYINAISHVGFLIVVASATMMLFSLLANLTLERLNPYVGIFTYLIAPGIVLFGVILILAGMRWEAGRRRKREALGQLPYPAIDLNDRRTRRIFGYSVVGGSLVATILAFAGYQGFLFTESVGFCGQTCHVPMTPEFTAHQDSAHARVPCVDCHVGEGASWYVRSKLSGAHQMLAVLFDSYQRPIPTPIKDLRPARETCEHCHWPEKFFGAKLLQLPHFRYDENNTPEQVSLTLKTGGGSKAHGKSTGIHWHMLIDNSVTFAADDEKLQSIPWVRVKRSDGSEATYVSKSTKLSKSQLAALPRRTMDCMDCHNRPAHGFPTPDSGIDQALLRGQISSSLPFIKKLSVEAMAKNYRNRDDAHHAIRATITGFYRSKYPDVLAKRKQDVERAIRVATSIYDRGVFHEMNVSWKTYPSNIGHRYWAGCFRCHDGQHVSSDGKVLSRDCNSTCHSQPQRGTRTDLGVHDPGAGDDWHPWEMPAEHIDIQGHDVVLCHQCHSAGQRPSKECKDCHEK